MGRWYQAARRTRRMPWYRCRIKWLGVAATARRRANRSPIRACISLPRYYTHYTSSWHAIASFYPSCGHVSIDGRAHRNSIVHKWHPVFFLNSLKIMKNMHTGSKNDHFYLFIRNNGCQKRVLKKKLKAYISKYFRQTKLSPRGNFHISGSPFYTVLTLLCSIRTRKLCF